jgi:hypothetical protein
MADDDDIDSNDTQSKINEEDRNLRMKERNRNEGEGPNDPVGGSNADTEASDGEAIRLGASSEYGAQHSPAEEEDEERSR